MKARPNLHSKSRLIPQLKSSRNLLLVTSGLPPSSGTLELASLGANEWLDVAAWATSSSKVSLSNTSLAWSLDHQGVLASGGSEGELVEGDDFTSRHPKFSFKTSLLRLNRGYTFLCPLALNILTQIGMDPSSL